MEKVVCLLFAQGSLSDSRLRKFIADHIGTDTVPVVDYPIHTSVYSQQEGAPGLPALVDQLLGFMSRPSAVHFQEPLDDGNGRPATFLVRTCGTSRSYEAGWEASQ